MTSDPMVIFTRTYDFITWLIPRTISFPRSQRFVVTRRLQDAALDKVRLYLRLAVRWQWLSEGQYQHVSRMVKEIGDLLGGWIKQTRGT